MIAEMKPMDRKDLMPCAFCKKGVLHTDAVHFYEVTISQCLVDIVSIRQQHGLEMMMGGAAAVAAALSPSTTVAHRMPPSRILVCSECALKDEQPIAMLAELADD